MEKRLHPPFPQENWPWNHKEFRGINLIAIIANVYNALFFNHIQVEIENILMKNQNSFQRNCSKTSKIQTICQIIEGIRAKNLEATLLFADFSKAFHSILSGKIEQILLEYGPPKETVTDIMPTKNMKATVHSADGNSKFFDNDNFSHNISNFQCCYY